MEKNKRPALVLVKMICFIFIFLLLFLYINRVFLMKRTDGVTPLLDLYQQKKDTVDVLFLGPSRVGLDISSDTLWEEYGIASYTLWGSMQPFWNSYYMLEEALKTQRPEAVILEVSAAGYTYDYQDNERQIVNTAAMKFSLNKWNAVKASSPVERWASLFLGLPVYHGRYTDLISDDFSFFSWGRDGIYDKGAGRLYGIMEGEIVQVPDIQETAVIDEKEEYYLRKIIEECRKNHISMMLISTPIMDASDEMKYCNAVRLIADEYQIPYYNFSMLHQMIGLQAGDYNDSHHMNVYGARKFSKYLGCILKETYELRDRRGNDGYNSWNVNVINLENEYISKAPTAEKYFMELENTGRAVLAVKNGSWGLEDKSLYLLEQLGRMGFDMQAILDSDETAGFFVQPDGKIYRDSAGNLVIGNTEFSIETADGTSIVINGKNKFTFGSAGIVLIVYDENTQKCIDGAAFLEADQWELQHWTP